MSEPGRAELRLLLLEDSSFDAELLQEALRATHPQAHCTLVGSRAAFESAWQAGTFDVVLSDYDVPGFGGLQALAMVRQAAPLLPFIFVSGVIGEDNAVELLRRGATDYVSKNRLERLPLVLDRALREATQRRDAELASQAKDRFIAMLSHELRVPLAAVSSAVHLLHKHAVLPEGYRHLLPLVRRNVAAEARLVDDLLDMTAISSGKLGIKPEPVDLRDVVRDAADGVAESVAERGQTLVLSLGPSALVVHADPVRLQQIVSNLLRNAVKFSETGGRIVLTAEQCAGQAELRCCDEGLGIAPQALQRIFAPFEQADRQAVHDRGGLGLGLAIALHLTQQHGGTLEAASPGLGCGATFTLRLPLAAQPAVTLPPAETVHAVRPTGQRVLLVEDHPSAAQALRLCLEEFGYAVAHAATVREALHLAEQDAFDVVLTDLGLPDGHGVTIGRALSARLPVVALSGFGSEADLRSTADAGFAGHLVKPADPVDVDAELRRVLARRG